MKRVLAFIPLPPPLAGPELSTQSLLNPLPSEPGWQVTIVRSNVRSSNEKKGKFDLSGIAAVGMSLGRLIRGCLFYSPRRIYFLLSSSRAGFLRDVAIILIGRIFRAELIAHYHGSNFHNFYRYAPVWYQRVIRFGLRRIFRIIVQGESVKSVFSGLYPRQQLAVLANGLSEEFAQRAEQFHLPKSKPPYPVTILFIGHISFTKGFYDLMKVYDWLVAAGSQIQLSVAGDPILDPYTQREFLSGPHRLFFEKNALAIQSEIRNFLKNPGRNVTVHGIVTGEAKYKLYEEADIFVLPSYTESFPNTMLEAMAFGLPLVISPVGAIPDVLRDTTHALFVKAGNQDRLKKKLEKLILNRELRHQMGEKNRVLALDRYLMSRIRPQFMKWVTT